MSYVLKNNPRNRSFFSRPLKVIFFLTIVLALIYFLIPQSLSSFFTAVVRPFWNVEKTIKYGSGFISAESLIKENEELKRASEKKAALNQSIDLIKKENDELKDLLGRSGLVKKTLAEILKKPPFSAYDTFVLDIGGDHGLEKGNRVYALGDIPIGEIAEVSSRTSKVKLYSSAGEKFNVIIGPEHIEATAVGKGGGAFETSLPRDTKIAKGDDVMIPSLNDGFVGRVEEVVLGQSNPFSTILFRLPVNIYELRWVLVEQPIANNK